MVLVAGRGAEVHSCFSPTEVPVRRPSLLFALAAILPMAVQAQVLLPATPDPRAPLFVDAGWLSQHLHDANLVLLHVGVAGEYAAAHIEGARLASVADVSVADTVRHLSVEMPGADTLRARLAALGISDDSRVIVYYARDMVYPATRNLFTLAYAGLGDRASLLDGGMGAWVAAGHPTSSEVPAARIGALSPLRTHDFVVDAAYVQSMIGRPGVAIVDARDTAFYGGSRTGGSPQAPHRAGHIPGAHSVPWSTLVDATQHIQPTTALAQAFSAAGIGARDVVIAYCHTGQQATALLTAARSLGHPVLLYDGSFQDWSARAEMPVEVGAPRKMP